MTNLRYNSPEVTRALSQHGAFTTPSMSGYVPTNEHVVCGKLPLIFELSLRQRLRDGRVSYIVVSYLTPIAWVLDGEEIVIPDVTYSTMTSRHQSVVREHLVGRPASEQASYDRGRADVKREIGDMMDEIFTNHTPGKAGELALRALTEYLGR